MTEEDIGVFERVVHRIEPDSRLLRAWTLTGGVSAQVTALDIEQPDGRAKKLVVRRHGDADLRRNPDVAADEFRLLRLLHAAGIPVPVPYGVDQSGTIVPTPYIVVEYVEGTPDGAPSQMDDLVRHMAALLVEIHRIDGSRYDLSFLPLLDESCTATLERRPVQCDDSLSEGLIRDCLEEVWPWPQHNTPVLLHGDYWPGNIIWREGRIAAIVDWEDAAVGDPLADVANARLELLWACGREAMDRFIHHYQSMASLDCSALPYWDLYAALRPISAMSAWGLDERTERVMRERHKLFVHQALALVSTR